MFLARGVDHCRAGEDAHRLPVESLVLELLVARGREHPTSLAPALMLMSKRNQSYEVAQSW